MLTSSSAVASALARAGVPHEFDSAFCDSEQLFQPVTGGGVQNKGFRGEGDDEGIALRGRLSGDARLAIRKGREQPQAVGGERRLPRGWDA